VILAVELPSIVRQTREIEALGFPKGEEKKLRAIIDAIEAGLRQARKNPYSIELENPGEDPFLKADLMIREYGFIGCRNVI
jgi:hypothetical protein